MIYHICNKSDLVIFRNEEDHFLMINKMAISALKTSTKILAFTIMSNHFHLIIKSESINLFIKLLKQSFTQSWNRKYYTNMTLFPNISLREINSNKEVLDAINYVLKNPLHHNVSNNPILYKYSSINYYFTIERNVKILEEQPINSLTTFTNLSSTQQRLIFANYKPLVNYEIINGIVISPKSFLDAKSVEFYYNSHKKFMYELLKPTNDEFALFNKLSRNDAELMMDIKCNKLTDIQVCKIIDDYVSEHNDVLSFIHLSNMQKDYIRNILNSLGVYPNQVKRCWM